MTSEERQKTLHRATIFYAKANDRNSPSEATADATKSIAASLLVIADCLANDRMDKEATKKEQTEYNERLRQKGKQA